MTTQIEPKRQHRIAAGGVAGIMLLLALSLWTVIPLAWLWIGSQVAATQFPSMGPYAIVLFGVIVSILVVAWILGLLNELYMNLTGTRSVAPIRMGWMKSLRDSEKAHLPPTVLEMTIVGSVIIAFFALLTWFATLAGSPLPSG
ncbi:MAG: hypothetical protein IPK93_06985 [Solirubrobacterales bacterium]|nr:hypothetical protein [Solirubrobacterales bacterium]